LEKDPAKTDTAIDKKQKTVENLATNIATPRFRSVFY
jgi:hypothetical protein